MFSQILDYYIIASSRSILHTSNLFKRLSLFTRRFRNANVHQDRLVKKTYRVDRTNFPGPSKKELNFDSGIKNLSIQHCSEDIRAGPTIVRYSPV